jgi:LysM repeat protein
MDPETAISIYDGLSQPPDTALKTIAGGRLKGMTDINPQWRIRALTEQFGLCGLGWKWEIAKLWMEPATDGQIAAFAQVHLFIKYGDEWSSPIPGIGGSMFVAKESSGLRPSDEAYKMAITDALSTAAKMVGVAANIYAGLSDSKYKQKQNAPAKNDAPKDYPNKATPKQVETLYKIATKNDLTNKELDQLANWYKKGKRLTVSEASSMIKDFKSILDDYLDVLQNEKGQRGQSGTRIIPATQDPWGSEPLQEPPGGLMRQPGDEEDPPL